MWSWDSLLLKVRSPLNCILIGYYVTSRVPPSPARHNHFPGLQTYNDLLPLRLLIPKLAHSGLEEDIIPSIYRHPICHSETPGDRELWGALPTPAQPHDVHLTTRKRLPKLRKDFN
jgi:hypothetical protein